MRVSQIAKLLDTRFNKERGERKGKKKKTLKTYQNFDDNITGIVEKTSMRQIQQYQGRLPTVTGVGHMKASEP
jgi:Ca2+-binding EF-hand superfamily protein